MAVVIYEYNRSRSVPEKSKHRNLLDSRDERIVQNPNSVESSTSAVNTLACGGNLNGILEQLGL
jgi:hypothetical protein